MHFYKLFALKLGAAMSN